MTESEFLLVQVREARAKYHELGDQCSEITRDILDAPSSDGMLSSAKLVRKHRELQTAFDEYSDALRRFTQVVLPPL